MLYVVATPIGNLEDLTARAVRVLREADVIACEDTRRTRLLLSQSGIAAPRMLISYREHREQTAGSKLLDLLREGRTVALCSDGGTPAISDPGYRLVSEAVEAGLDVACVPGASAVLAALVVSGLSTSSFTFKGYPPRKRGALRRFFEEDRDRPHTLVVLESPFRTAATLKAALEVLGDRRAAVCVELTKKFERVSRGFLSGLVSALAASHIKGEVTLVIAGNHPKFVNPASASGPGSPFCPTPERESTPA